jgi:hypothetical protein
MSADPFLFVSPADKRVIAKARRRGPKALDQVARALARKALDLANKKDRQREKDLADETIDVAWPPSFLQKSAK